MDNFIDLLKEVNIAQIVIIFGAMWFFYSRLDRKIDRLAEKVDNLDKRLCRIEGSLATQGHCLFHQDNKEKKSQ